MAKSYQTERITLATIEALLAAINAQRGITDHRTPGALLLRRDKRTIAIVTRRSGVTRALYAADSAHHLYAFAQGFAAATTQNGATNENQA